MLELAREADWHAVHALSVQIHSLHTAWRSDLYIHCDEPYPKEKFLSDIRQRMVYVARIDQMIAGFVVLSITQKQLSGVFPHRAMQLEAICVEESIRGHGIGKEMVSDVRVLARAFGCREVVLSVHAENDTAVGFYQKCGFTIRSIKMQMST